jgi:hypothetical protein
MVVSLQSPQSVATTDLQKQHLVPGFSLFIHGSPVLDYSS